MIAVPWPTPVITPLLAPTDTTPLVPQVHVANAPVLASLRVIELPVPLAHRLEGPVMATGVWFTVTTWVAGPVPHPLLKEMVAVPAAIPFTTPVENTTAVVISLLLHTPEPPKGSANVVETPVHVVGTPVIGPGAGFTTNVATAAQVPTV